MGLSPLAAVAFTAALVLVPAGLQLFFAWIDYKEGRY